MESIDDNNDEWMRMMIDMVIMVVNYRFWLIMIVGED